MTFGVKVLNNANTVQIDDTYRNLEFKTSGTINTSSLSVQQLNAGGYRSAGTVTITTTHLPIFAFRDTQGDFSLTFITALGSNQYMLSLEIYRPTAAHYDITYYVYGYSTQTSQTALPAIGFVTRNSIGDIVYRSDQKSFNAVDLITDLSPLATTGYSTTRTYDTGRIYAVAFWRDNSGTGIYDSGGLEYLFSGGFNCSGNTVRSTWRMWGTRNQTIAGSVQDSLLAFVVDVTGL
jgi:hypothetical protein